MQSILEDKMDDKNKPLPWDYFLTNYEKDLLQLPMEEVIRKYSRISREQITKDFQELKAGQNNPNE